MSVINYQSIQDLDMIDPYYFNGSTNLWCQQPSSSSSLQLSSVPFSLTTPVSNMGVNNFQQSQSQSLINNQQQRQMQYDALNNCNNLSYMKNNEKDCYNPIQSEFVQPLVNQPITTVGGKLNVKQPSLSEFITCKDEQILYFAQDSRNDIQNAQTCSNSLLSEIQLCSSSTIQTHNNKMTISSAYPINYDAIKPNTDYYNKNNQNKNKESLNEFVSPLPLMKQHSHPINNDLNFQPSCISSSTCTPSSLCCQPSTSNISKSSMNSEIKMGYGYDNSQFRQQAYFPQKINNQHQNQFQNSEFYSDTITPEFQGSGQGYQLQQKICPYKNNQFPFQVPSLEEKSKQLPTKINSDGGNKQQISNFDRHYEQEHQNNNNNNNFKHFERTQIWQTDNNKNENHNNYFEKEQTQNQMAGNGNNILPAIESNIFQTQNQNYIEQAVPTLQNINETRYYDTQQQPCQSAYKRNERMQDFKYQNGVQISNQNGLFNQSHNHNQNDDDYQNYQQATKYECQQYDGYNYCFDQERNSVIENSHYQTSNTSNYNQQYQNSNHHHNHQQEKINQVYGNRNELVNQKQKYYQISFDASSSSSSSYLQKINQKSTIFSNALNNASLTIYPPIKNVNLIYQDPHCNFQQELIRSGNQNHEKQRIREAQFQEEQYNEERKDSQRSAIDQQYINEIQSEKKVITHNNSSIDTIVSPTYTHPKHFIPLCPQNQNQSIIQYNQGNSQSSSQQTSTSEATNTFNIICSPTHKKSASFDSLRLSPKNSPYSKKISKRSFDSTYQEDPNEKELRLQLDCARNRKKLSIDTQSLEVDGEYDNDDDDDNNQHLIDSQDNNSSINKQLLALTQKKKNVVKNIMSAFKTFVLSWGCKKSIESIFNSSNQSFEEIDDIQKKFKRYIGSKSFNHYSLRLLILHLNYGPIFKLFLSKFSEEWLENSKIKDTESHQKMVLFFLSCFDNIKTIDTLRRHPKKKCRFS